MSDAPIVSVEGDHIYYRASALGMCPRALWAARTGQLPADPPPAMQEIFNRGHEIEELVVDLLNAQGLPITLRQEEFILNLGESRDGGKFLHIRGHIDGFSIEKGVVEIKGFGAALLDQYRKQGLASFHNYHLQISAYCHAFETEDYLFVIYDKDLNEIAIQDESPVPLLSRDDVVKSVYDTELWLLENGIDVPPACTLQYPCPYYYLHDERPTLTSFQSTAAKAYLYALGKEKEWVERKKYWSDKLHAELQESSEDAHYVVSLVPYPSRLDERKVRQALADAQIPIEQFMTKRDGHFIRVTDRKRRSPRAATPDLADD